MESNQDSIEDKDMQKPGELNPDQPEVISEENQMNPPRKHKHHDDHHVSRKYKMFSNHSSANDMPHTNTSF